MITTDTTTKRVQFPDGLVLELHAMGLQGCKYACRIHEQTGDYSRFCTSVDSWKDIISNTNVLASVLYCYHQKKHSFEIVKAYKKQN